MDLVCLLLQFVVLDFVIEAATGGTSSWIRRCLSLTLDRLDYFASFRIYLSEGVHAALACRVQNVVPTLAKATLTRNSSTACCSGWRSHHLSLPGMVHLRLLINRRCNIQTRWRPAHDDLVIVLVLAHVC